MGGAKRQGFPVYIAKAKYEGKWHIAQLACEIVNYPYHAWRFVYAVNGKSHLNSDGEVLCAPRGQVCTVYCRMIMMPDYPYHSALISGTCVHLERCTIASAET